MAERQFTGKHALAVFVLAFGVIITVNLLLAYNAVSTFPGLVVKNSYVASQGFNDRLKEQRALGWTASARATGGLVILQISDAAGNPVEVEGLNAVIERPTHVRDDLSPPFTFDGTAYVAQAELGEGNWNVRVSAQDAAGAEFSQLVSFYVKG